MINLKFRRNNSVTYENTNLHTCACIFHPFYIHISTIIKYAMISYSTLTQYTYHLEINLTESPLRTIYCD